MYTIYIYIYVYASISEFVSLTESSRLNKCVICISSYDGRMPSARIYAMLSVYMIMKSKQASKQEGVGKLKKKKRKSRLLGQGYEGQ